MSTDVVIIGAGPVGLWAAIQLKKRNPRLNVQIYERYTEYKRSHVLKLKYTSMMLYSKKCKDPAEAAFYKHVTGKSSTQVAMEAAIGKHVFIRTNDLEDALKTYAKTLGVNIDYKKIDTPEQVETMHPECKYFIAADGARSAMRDAVMGTDAVDSYPLQHIVELKYETKGATSPLKTADHFRVNKHNSAMTFEYVGNEKQDKTPVSLRFFIDEDTYNAMPEASFKEPLTLDNKNIPPDFAKDIAAYMSARKTHANENYIKGSEKMSKLQLSLYKAKKFAVKHGDKNWFLVGDAAMGVPYFRSLNAGMIISSQLGYILTRRILSEKAKINAYNTMKPLDIAWEFTVAKGKNTALDAYDSFRRMSKKLSQSKPEKPQYKPK